MWICVLSEYSLSTYYGPVTGLVALETLENKIEEGLCSHDAHMLIRGDTKKQGRFRN